MIASRTKKPLFSVVTLFLFFLFFCVNQGLHAQCTAPAHVTYSHCGGPANGCYPSGYEVSKNGRTYRSLNSNNGTTPPSVGWWADLGACPTSSAPTVTTDAASVINCSSATGGGNVTDGGSETVTDRGVCWSTSSSPTTSDSKTSDASGTGTFTSSITGLSSGQTYYVRAYATNSVGTSYGSEVQFVANLTVASSSGGSRVGTGTVGLSATTSSGAGNINWYVAASGGAALSPTSSSGATWTTPSISVTTTYYAEADDGSCTSPTRTAVVAAVNEASPGNVASNLHLWLKADAQAHNSGTTAATNGQDVDNWYDQSENSFNATTGTDPTWDEDAINFNPAILFDDDNSEYLDIPTGIYGTDNKLKMFSYVVAKK
jgi:hypothetical protein